MLRLLKHRKVQIGSKRTCFILVRDIANAMDKAKKKEEMEKNQPKPSTSKKVKDEIEEDDDDIKDLMEAT
jgi:hypothetical protein